MKVVLFTLNGSWSHSSLALRCLREPLERAGFEAVLLERNLRDRTAHVLEALVRERAEIYGFSCYIWNLTQMLSLAADLHKLLPKCRIVLGGPEVSFATERFDGTCGIDAIVTGEGEDLFPELCCKIRNGEPFERILHGGKTNVMQNEGILYRAEEAMDRIAYYESSRGCPHSCAYCLSSATVGVRMKSVEQTLRDLLAFEGMPCKTVKLVDRTFNADPKRANRIWEALLGEQFTKCYHFEVCASLLDEEGFEILSKFPKGKIQLEFGLQSTNEQTLEAVSRHIDPKRVISAVRRIHEMGNTHVHLDLIAGLPFESYERFAKSFDDAYGCCDMLQLGFLKLLHGTRLREQMEDYGYVCTEEPPYTVLQSKWITYEELQMISHLAEVRERFDESGRFAHTLWYLMPMVPSPFAFWEGFTRYLSERDERELQKISQPEAYRYLMDYATEAVGGADPSILREMLRADFSTHEHKSPPWFLASGQ